MNPNTFAASEIFLAAVHLIRHELIPRAAPRRQRLLAKVARILAAAARELAERPPPVNPSMAPWIGLAPPSASTTRQSWGWELRRRRESVGLTRRKLARQAGLAESTVRNLEFGRHPHTRSIVMRLQAVPAIGLPTSPGRGPWPLGGGPDALVADGELSCNCWFAPEYDAIRSSRELAERLNGAGGLIEQTLLYSDPASAAAYCAMTEEASYRQGQLMMPLRELATAVAAQLGNQPLDVIGLGAGEAKAEVRLVQELLGTGSHDLRLILVDLSQPMLSAGYKHAASGLAEEPGVGVFAIQGNFHDLPSYLPQLESAKRRRLVCMFGHTFCALENELRFVRHSLCGLAVGDLFIFNVPMMVAPADQPQELLRKDPLLTDELKQGAPGLPGCLYEFYVGPFKRYVRGLQRVSLSCVLDEDAGPVPGSYAVAWRARVQTDHGPERVYSLGGPNKRYDPIQLRDCLQGLGWQLVKLWLYPAERYRFVLFLYRKTEGSARHRVVPPATRATSSPTIPA